MDHNLLLIHVRMLPLLLGSYCNYSLYSPQNKINMFISCAGI